MEKLITLTCLLLTLNLLAQENRSACKNGEYLIEQSQQFHDPNDQWGKISFNVHIQEPRLQNPGRYSIVALDKSQATFRLDRNRDQYISSHIIDKEGTAQVLLDGKAEFPENLVKEYRLETDRVKQYQDFYNIMYGLPMSLDQNIVEEIKKVQTVEMDGKEVFEIALKLKRSVISEHWKLLVAVENYQLLGIELLHPETPDEGERLVFEDLVTVKEVQIPRIRHWYDLQATYLGSDIIIKEIE